LSGIATKLKNVYKFVYNTKINYSGELWRPTQLQMPFNPTTVAALADSVPKPTAEKLNGKKLGYGIASVHRTTSWSQCAFAWA
jgi:hypothetical protein